MTFESSNNKANNGTSSSNVNGNGLTYQVAGSMWFNALRQWSRAAQFVLALITLICTAVTGSSFFFTDTLNFLIFCSLMTILGSGFLLATTAVSTLSLFLGDRVQAGVRVGANALYDGFALLFWFAGSVAVATVSSNNAVSTLCWQAATFGIRFYNCHALVATAFFSFMVWFSFFPSCYFTALEVVLAFKSRRSSVQRDGQQLQEQQPSTSTI